MEILQTIIIILLVTPLTLLMTGYIIQGLKTGRVRHTDSKKIYDQKKNPIKFWLIITLYTFFLIATLWAAYQALL